MTVLISTIADPIATLAFDHPIPGFPSQDLCEIQLMADRTATLRGGSTHKVYRTWRFEVVRKNDQFPAGRTIYVAPIDPVRWVASRSHYALAQHADQGAIDVGGASRFSWAATRIGGTDPLAAAHDQAQQWLVSAGWNQDVTNPAQYRRSALPACTGLDEWEEEGGSTKHDQ